VQNDSSIFDAKYNQHSIYQSLYSPETCANSSVVVHERRLGEEFSINQGTPIMIQKILILGSVLAIAGVAQAAPVNVAFEGKSPAAVRADLLKAAKQVCKEASDPFTSESDYQDCVSATYADALQKLRRVQTANASTTGSKVASR
jgi:hypothetical protein